MNGKSSTVEKRLKTWPFSGYPFNALKFQQNKTQTDWSLDNKSDSVHMVKYFNRALTIKRYVAKCVKNTWILYRHDEKLRILIMAQFSKLKICNMYICTWCDFLNNKSLGLPVLAKKKCKVNNLSRAYHQNTQILLKWWIQTLMANVHFNSKDHSIIWPPFFVEFEKLLHMWLNFGKSPIWACIEFLCLTSCY